MEFRLLKAEEIDVKVGTVTKGGVTLLLYKNARVDMAILDETVGAENWQRDHKEVKGNLYCGIGINVNANKMRNNEPLEPLWVWKWDCGVESAFGDKEKGEASDSFKRAGFNWGIGRELYTSPFIFVPCETEKAEVGGFYIKNIEDKKRIAGLKVQSITYNSNREIESICIVDSKGEQVYPQQSQVFEDKPNSDKVIEKTISHSKTELHCSSCDEVISEKVAKYSLDKFGKQLCFDCQKLNAEVK